MKAIEFAVVLMICGMLIATSAIGIQYYNMCPSLKKDPNMRQNKHFLVGALVTACISTAGVFLLKDNRRTISTLFKKFV